MNANNTAKQIHLGKLPSVFVHKEPVNNDTLLSILQEMQNCFSSESTIEKVILFGSFSTGNSSEDSDLDLLVLINKKGFHSSYKDRLSSSCKISKLCNPLRTRIAVDVIVYTLDEFDYLTTKNSLFLKEIQQTGIIVYERNRSDLDVTF